MDELAIARRIHLIGVGGAGMSALAKLLAQLGHTVSGSDLAGGEELAKLGDLGLNVWRSSRPEALSGVEVVVASSAVPDRDPEWQAARRLGAVCWQRPDLLEALTFTMPAIGVTGTHGKTTTTAMLVSALRALGRDPSFVLGGEMLELRTNAHLGERALFVLEADEAFRTFERISFSGLVVTNVEAEHLDHFGTLADLEDSFIGVVNAVNGPAVLGADDDGARRVARRTGRPTFGVAPEARWRIRDLADGPDSVRFLLSGPDGGMAVEVARPGIHNARNAAGALALLGEMGFDWRRAASGLSEFKGVRRRFEMRGSVGGVTIIDDYAHHPSEVVAVLQAASHGGWARTWAVFQPHLYSRTAMFHRQFGEALAAADRVVVTDVYASRESPEPGVTGELVAEAARRAGGAVTYIPHRSDVAAFLADEVSPGDLVLTMGAGDITLVPAELASLLAPGPVGEDVRA